MRIWLLRALMVLVLAAPAIGGLVVPPNLGTAYPFGLLAGTVSNTGTSVVTGDVGATVTITGFPPGTSSTGNYYTAPNAPGTTVGLAYTDFVSAFNLAYSDTSTPPTQTLSGLSGPMTLLGNTVYNFSSTDVSSVASTILTFDANNNSSEVFIIKVSRDLQINAPITFHLTDGALSSNIYWIIGRDATISGATDVLPVTWDGNILAGRNFTMSAGTGGSGPLAGTINGCVFAETTATLGGTTDIGGCTASTFSGAPEPGSSGLVALGCLLGGLGLRKFRSVRRTR
ncbi:MAG: ice-binding family protein [Candidatus Solibacter sp.]